MLLSQKNWRWINWINRERLVLLAGSVALALGAILPWYRLPAATLEVFHTNLAIANIGRLIAALFAIFGFVFTFQFTFSSQDDTCSIPKNAAGFQNRFRIAVWSGLIGILLFPYFVTTWCPTVTFVAASYYNQNSRASHHIEKNFSQVQAQWKQQIVLGRAAPNRSTFDFSISNSRFFQIPAWDQFIIEGLGYSNNFIGFIGKGWVLTTIGLLFCLSAFYFSAQNLNFNVFLQDMGKILPLICLIAGILSLSLVLPNIVNHQLDTMFVKGQYERVLTASQVLANWYPPLQGDTRFNQRITAAGYYREQPDSSLLYFSRGVERFRRGDLLQAEELFRRALELQPKNFLARGYLATTIINQGVDYFNNRTSAAKRAPGVAADRFEQALQIFPGHIEALYNLMLTRVVTGEFDKSARVAQQIIEMQKYFQSPSLALLGQAYLHSAWNSYQQHKIGQAWQQYRQAIDKSAWGDGEKVGVEE
jgi:tetratricopeptide (TPR) repeat protein